MIRFLLYRISGLVFRKRTVPGGSPAPKGKTVFYDKKMSQFVAKGKLDARVFPSFQPIQITVNVEPSCTVLAARRRHSGSGHN